MKFPYILATSQKCLYLSFKESKSHMLSILNFASSVTHWAVFYATLIAPIAGMICHFFYFLAIFAFCLNHAHCSFLRFLLLPFTQAKKSRPFGFLRILHFAQDSAAIHYKIPPLVKQVHNNNNKLYYQNKKKKVNFTI